MTTDTGLRAKDGLGHDDCILCGWRDPLRLGLKFEHDGNGGLRARLSVNRSLQGYDGILHGGMVSAVLDAAMTHCLIHMGIPALTAELRVRFTRPIPCEGDLEISARLVEARPPLYRVSAELLSGGEVHASAEAAFIHRR